MQLSKHHGLGNDFLVALTDEVPDLGADLARAWCHRTHGVGADGLIFGTPTDTADLQMTLFNSDGSLAEISGNGIRCLAQAAFTSVGGNHVTIATAGGVRRLELIATSGNTAQIGVEMGEVTLHTDPVDLELVRRPSFATERAMTGSVGNPHVVIEVDSFDGIDPAIDGPAIEASWKPEGINVHFLAQTGPETIRLVHWERGAGVTEACGMLRSTEMASPYCTLRSLRQRRLLPPRCGPSAVDQLAAARVIAPVAARCSMMRPCSMIRTRSKPSASSTSFITHTNPAPSRPSRILVMIADWVAGSSAAVA